jgi:hypothetical protein
MAGPLSGGKKFLARTMSVTLWYRKAIRVIRRRIGRFRPNETEDKPRQGVVATTLNLFVMGSLAIKKESLA